MRAHRPPLFIRQSGQPAAGFTMIEIALCLAIVAFALVAILGVLPTGLRVKKDNREDSIINEDGAFLMEAIRSGSRGLDELTNFVEEIDQSINTSNVVKQTVVLGKPVSITNFVNYPIYPDFSAGGAIIGALSWPTYQPSTTTAGEILVSKITARMRGMSGSALDRGRVNRDFTFRYMVTPEIIPYTMAPVDVTTTRNQYLQQLALTNNLYELRLTLQWPVYPHGSQWDVGRNHKTFRTLVNGQLAQVKQTNFFFQPNVFTNLTLNGNY